MIDRTTCTELSPDIAIAVGRGAPRSLPVVRTPELISASPSRIAGPLAGPAARQDAEATIWPHRHTSGVCCSGRMCAYYRKNLLTARASGRTKRPRVLGGLGKPCEGGEGTTAPIFAAAAAAGWAALR